jgi:transcriptional regulator GlxA family with amidase domain
MFREGFTMKTVQMLLFDGADELDVCGVFEVLASCRTLVNGRWGDKSAFHVETVAEHRTTVECAHGMKINADRSLTGAHTSDIVIVPGGPGARQPNLPTHILEYLDYANRTAQVVASVCTGAFILARAGLTDGYEVTTHHSQLETLAKMYPKTKVLSDQRVVISGKNRNLMTSAGISAGIDLALCLINRCEGQQSAVLAGKRLEWPGYYDYKHPHRPDPPTHFAMKPPPVGAR